MEANKKEKRGRNANPAYSKETLLQKLREIQLSGNREKLTYLKLEKITAIPRRNWIKVKEFIEKINDGYSVDVENFVCDLALPNVDEVFNLYYGKNEEKLKNIFRDYNVYLNQMWQGYSNFQKSKQKYDIELREMQNKIEQLEGLMIESEKEKFFYKTKYEVMCVESSDRHKRETKNIKGNVIHIKKGDNTNLSLDFDNEFKEYLQSD